MQRYDLLLDKFIEHAAKWHPDTEIVTCAGSGSPSTRIGYAGLRERANRVSGSLMALGLKQGDRIATLAWNSQSHVECWFAALGMGIVVHTLNPRIGVDRLIEMTIAAGDRAIFASSDQMVLAHQIAESCPCIENVVDLEEPGAAPRASGFGRGRTWTLSTLLSEHGKPVAWGGFPEDADAGICFTSGTTGAPKGVVYTHRSNYLETLSLNQADVIALGSRDSVLVAVPMFHANGWGMPFAAPAVGAKMVLPGRHLDGESLAGLIRSEHVTVALGVATVWIGLLEYLDAEGGDLPSLQRVILGGTPVPQALMDRIERRLGVTCQTSWGMTELSPLGTLMPPGEPLRAASLCGRPPVGVDLLLTNAEGSPLPEQRGKEGYLRVRGAAVVERYLGQEQTALDANGWFDTGDLAIIDARGFISITGRAKDLIKSGGEWINPGEIETIIGALPEVALVAVIGRVHPKWTERPIVVIESRDGQTLVDADIYDALDGRIPRWWMPDAIEWVVRMPLAATGKIDKASLRASLGNIL
jgi:acyl-CoA synthetase (AMP-forming)/AMP-acid ligase II